MKTVEKTPLSSNLQQPGNFLLGCNYWASHAGTAMWSDWQPEVVRADFAKLSAHGLQTLRVFPLWPDFQPITQLRGGGGTPVEIRLGEQPLPFDQVGQAGISRLMLQRFAEFCRLADEAGLQLIVGLVTGWMSGRLFVPPALEGLDPITDPVSLTWQIKFVRTFVDELRDQTAIYAWDLGNECNCMGHSPSREAAYLWTASIAQAIRVCDSTRPIVSGMHSLSTPISHQNSPWTIDVQGELTDILTTHPYPYWVRHTRADAVNSLRTTLHPTAETRFYSDISGKPCFAEEIGTMGPMVAGDEVSADFARVNLFSLWANDCRGFLWWCAHDQTHLTHAPYDWNGVETELGLLRIDGSAKPVLREMSVFREFLKTLPFTTLPACASDAVCILTHNQDDWAAAFGAYVLAKQAKLNLSFRHIQQTIPESSTYLLPSLTGPNAVPRRQWLDLITRVKAGATLYLSLSDGIVPHFNEIAGVELLSRGTLARSLEAVFHDGSGLKLPLTGGDDLLFVADAAEVLATRSDNHSPVFWDHKLGQGRVIFYAAPVEVQLTLTPGAFDEGAPQFVRIYEEIAKSRKTPRLLTIVSPSLAVTEHPLTEGGTVVIVINHTGSAQSVTAQVAFSAKLGNVWKGHVQPQESDLISIHLQPHDAAVFELQCDGR